MIFSTPLDLHRLIRARNKALDLYHRAVENSRDGVVCARLYWKWSFLTMAVLAEKDIAEGRRSAGLMRELCHAASMIRTTV